MGLNSQQVPPVAVVNMVLFPNGQVTINVQNATGSILSVLGMLEMAKHNLLNPKQEQPAIEVAPPGMKVN